MLYPCVSMIYAVSQNGVIGDGNKLPWHYPEDLKLFKKITTGNAVLMGRKTAESLAKPLSNRVNIVLTKNPKWNRDGMFVTDNIEKAIKFVHQDLNKCLFVIGGAEIYQLALPYCQAIFQTLIKKEIKGDIIFTPDLALWNIAFESSVGNTDLAFNVLLKRSTSSNDVSTHIQAHYLETSATNEEGSGNGNFRTPD